jgi:hypothetical protein
MYYEHFHFEVTDIRAMEEKVFQHPNNLALYKEDPVSNIKLVI